LSSVIHHLYFSPGMFGFTRLASYNYFSHVERAVQERFRKVGHAIETHVSDVLPTASVRRRAARLAELIEHTAAGDGPIHLLGHSIGGLDARLVAQQLILEKKGWFMANVVGAVLDLEVQVEAVVAERVRTSLASEGVAAIVEQVVTE
jgi:thioesterase domain-containing protein